MWTVRRELGARTAKTEGPPVFRVFEALDDHGQSWALKVGNAKAVRHEFDILRSLSHPAIVSAHELVDDLPAEAAAYELGFTMDLLPGVNFIDWIRGDLGVEDEDAPRRNLPMAFGYRMQAEGRSAYQRCSEQGLRRIRQAAPLLGSALAVVHDQSLAHFDVQPDNIVCSDAPVLVDFGNTVSLGMELRALYGMPNYVAPEFAHEGIVTEAIDAYALGALLFEAVTGQLPFPGDDPVQVMTAKLTLAAPAPSELVEDVPEDLEALIGALLARSAAERPPLREVAAFLETA